MAREIKEWHPHFLEYMDMIIHHPHYRGLPIAKKEDGSYSWIATAKSEIGLGRIQWCKKKAKELGIPDQPGMYADVMLTIHPTKTKVCQTCGREMSLYYHYPNVAFLNSLNKEFNTSFTDCDSIFDIWNTLKELGYTDNTIGEFLAKKGDLQHVRNKSNKVDMIRELEYACRKGGKKCLGPGAMSNFPDRFDGFHTYNRCCRSSQDKGRSKENLKSYTKDRRAYELWSNGNIHAANQFMGSDYFKGISADHIGPISLGFIHDPRYLQPMKTNDNSSKRDRLSVEDIEKIIETYQRTNVYPMSWYSKRIWNYIVENYKSNLEKVPTIYRDALKQNVNNYMYILWFIINRCKEKGKDVLEKLFLAPNYKCFMYDYRFDEKGNIIEVTKRHFTERSSNEMERYKRIAFDSVEDYHEKENRQLGHSLNSKQNALLVRLCNCIDSNDLDKTKHCFLVLMADIQSEIIKKL